MTHPKLNADMLDLARNVAGLDDSMFKTSDLRLLRATLHEYRDHARTIMDNVRTIRWALDSPTVHAPDCKCALCLEYAETLRKTMLTEPR